MEPISYEEFQEKRESSPKPIVVVCCLPDGCCRPSDAMVDTVRKVAETREDFDFFTIDAREEKDYPIEFELDYAPETTIFYQGKTLKTISGLRSFMFIWQTLDEIFLSINK